MTREEVREGLSKILGENCRDLWDDDCFETTLDEMLNYLHAQGVVIKVDGELELPARTWYKDWGGESGIEGYTLAVKDMLNAGYTAFEPLIEDGHNDH